VISALTYHDRTPPAEWLTALRAVSPKSDVHSWAYLHWLSRDQRWVLYECVPNAYVSPVFREMLAGPHPDSDPDTLITDFQWRMYRRFGVHARPFWVVQGFQGGHYYSFDRATRELMKAMQKPVEPPAVGALPYAPFDGRVVRQLINHNRLAQLKNDLHALHTSGNAVAYQAQIQAAKKQARAAMIRFMDEQMTEADEYLMRASKAGELDDTKRSAVDWTRKLELGRQNFIEHGHYHAPNESARIWIPT
jgi:hypothetical protein